jgi:hypothetical protein
VWPPHCGNDVAPGWPQFNDANSLNNSPWAKYFQEVYGGVPQSGYPICIGSFSYLVFGALQRAGISKTPSNACGSSDGDYYKTMPCCDLQSPGSSWIWNDKYFQPLPSNKWVEGIHKAFFADKGSAWIYYAPGSALWFYLGQTKAFTDHEDAVKEFTGRGCSGQCVNDFPRTFAAAASKGYGSIQFLAHSDMKCGRSGHGIPSQGGSGKNGAVEIVDVKGHGTSPCASNYKAGWEASQTCNCDSSLQYANCKGFGDPQR